VRATVAGFIVVLWAAAVPLQSQVAGPGREKPALGIRHETAPAPDYRFKPDQPGIGRLLVGGVTGAGVAIAATHLIYQANGGGRICGDDPCGMYAGIMSLVLLQPILIPVGVHLANHRRGSFAGTFFASLVTGAAGLYVGSRANLGDGMLIVIPAVQITISALIERASENGQER
jgi:hypothetical protein